MSSRVWKDWLPIGLLLLANVLLSTDNFDAKHTGSLLETVLGWCGLSYTDATLDSLHHLLRKLGHFTGYAVLTLLVARAIRLGDPFRRALLVASLMLVWCGLDEYHQTWTAHRQGSVGDAGLDFAGCLSALTALGAVYLVRLLRRRPGRGSS